MELSKQRIWELDAFRGICILGMVCVHFVIDLDVLLGLQMDYPLFFRVIRSGGAVLFILLSGICVTLGSHAIRRGLIVLGCGMLFTLVTVGACLLHLADRSFLVQFGILHLLGTSMLLSVPLSRLSNRALGLVGLVLLAVGYWFLTQTVSVPWLFPLGLATSSFVSADWFPLLPHLGWFCLGMVAGRTVYRSRRSLLPRLPAHRQPLRFFCQCGRHSLWIYLLHQPLLYLMLQPFIH